MSAALDPFRVPAPERDRPLLPYLRESRPGLHDIDLEQRTAAARAMVSTRAPSKPFSENSRVAASRMLRRRNSAFIDGVEYDGKKPNEYLSKFPIGLKDEQTVAGNQVVGG